MTEKSVLLSGASGMLGTALLQKFVKVGWHVTALYNNNPIAFQHELISPIKVDIQNKAELSTKLNGKLFDVFIHCAACTNLELCEQDLSVALSANVVGTKNLLDVIRRSDGVTTKTVYISSDAVYPDVGGSKLESLTACPSTIYGLTKLWGEQLISLYSPQSLIFRTTIIGPAANQFISWIIQHGNAQREIPLFTDVYFTPISVDNLSEIIYLAIVKNLADIYNAGATDSMSKAQFGKLVLTEANLPCKIKPTELSSLRSSVKRSHNMSLDSTALYDALQHPGFSIIDAVKSAVATLKRP